MADYRLTDRKFSRLWRRNKSYSEHELRYLAQKRRLTLRQHNKTLQILDPKTNKVVANFQETAKDEHVNGNERS